MTIGILQSMLFADMFGTEAMRDAFGDMAFVRNWVDTLGPDAINSKALSVVIGGGWAFRTNQRVGLQFFAAQHALALGDLQTAHADVPDVMGNSWSIGAAIVFR